MTDKNEFIKNLIGYLFIKQKNFLRELEQENNRDRISYLKGGLADTIDMMGYIVYEYKIEVEEERKSEVKERTKDLLEFFRAEIEEENQTEETKDYIFYLEERFTL